MAPETQARRLLGSVLGAAGVLVGGLSGLCTGGFFLWSVVFTWSAPDLHTALAVYDNLSLPWIVGGLPIGLGLAAVVLSGPVAGAQPRRRLAWGALIVALFILAGALPDAAIVLIRGPGKPARYELDFNPRHNRSEAPTAAVGGLVLLAAAVYELRRRAPHK